MTNNNSYNFTFYESQLSESVESAKIVIPVVNNLLNPNTIIDIGCGVGGWLNEWKKLNKKITGIDAPFVEKKLMQIEENEFISIDFNKELPSVGKFDLAMCLEVAEHLPEERAFGFIKEITYYSDFILFSAAIPGQEGTQHINEQYLDYWIKIFESVNYKCYDVIRPIIWDNKKVCWWYRQNCVLFIKNNAENQIKVDIMISFENKNLIINELFEYKNKELKNITAEYNKICRNPFYYLYSFVKYYKRKINEKRKLKQV